MIYLTLDELDGFGRMMTSSQDNIFRITGPLWGDRKVDSPLARTCTWTNGWANASDLRHNRPHNDVTIMVNTYPYTAHGLGDICCSLDMKLIS